MGSPAGKPMLLVEAQGLIGQLEQAAEREACWSCECLQGLITQLQLDASEEVKLLLQTYEVRKEHLHGCLGCEPCLPAGVFAEYARGS